MGGRGRMRAFDVYLHGQHVDTVFFDRTFARDEVRHSLIAHDRYDYRIVVKDDGATSQPALTRQEEES